MAPSKIGQDRRVERGTAFKFSRRSRRHMEISCHTLSHSRKSRTGLLNSHCLGHRDDRKLAFGAEGERMCISYQTTDGSRGEGKAEMKL